jgi:hypothetical protein
MQAQSDTKSGAPITRLRTPRGQLVLLSVTLISLIGASLAPPETQAVAWATAIQFIACTLFILGVWEEDAPFPLFNLGVLFGIIAFLYTTVPFAMFWAAGGVWTPLSDGRLLLYNPDASEMRPFAWIYVAFFVSYVVVHLATRKQVVQALPPVQPPDRATFKTVAIAVFIVQGYLWGLQAATGITLDPSYLDQGLDQFSGYYNLPFFIQQITHNAVGAAVALKIILVGAILTRWRTPTARALVIVWVLAEIALTVVNFGSRTYAVIFALGVILLWHRIVAPIPVRTAAVAAVVSLVGITLFGLIRTFGGSFAAVQLADSRIWTAQNDFQTMFASAFDIDRVVRSGQIASIPRTIYFSDLYLLIPSQFLPFTKLEPSAWYYGTINATTSSMFGMMAQGVIGFGWVEMALRGAFMGWLYNVLHRLYAKNATSFWMTLLYCYALVWCHYSFRSTMLWPAYFLAYEFLPVMILVRVLRALFLRLSRTTTSYLAPIG